MLTCTDYSSHKQHHTEHSNHHPFQHCMFTEKDWLIDFCKTLALSLVMMRRCLACKGVWNLKAHSRGVTLVVCRPTYAIGILCHVLTNRRYVKPMTTLRRCPLFKPRSWDCSGEKVCLYHRVSITLACRHCYLPDLVTKCRLGPDLVAPLPG